MLSLFMTSVPMTHVSHRNLVTKAEQLAFTETYVKTLLGFT